MSSRFSLPSLLLSSNEDSYFAFLRALPVEQNLTSQDILALCKKLDWRSLDSASKCQALLTQLVKDSSADFEELAHDIDISSQSFWRNLLACSEASTRPGLQFLIEANEAWGNEVLGSNQAKIMDDLPANKIVNALMTLLVDPARLTSTQLGLIAPRQRAACLHHYLRQRVPAARKKKNLELLPIFRSARKIYGPEANPRVVLLAVQRALIRQSLSAKKIGKREFLMLDDGLQSALTASPVLLDRFVASQYRHVLISMRRQIVRVKKLPILDLTHTIQSLESGNLSNKLIPALEFWRFVRPDFSKLVVNSLLKIADTSEITQSTALAQWCGTTSYDMSIGFLSVLSAFAPLEKFLSYPDRTRRDIAYKMNAKLLLLVLRAGPVPEIGHVAKLAAKKPGILRAWLTEWDRWQKDEDISYGMSLMSEIIANSRQVDVHWRVLERQIASLPLSTLSIFLSSDNSKFHNGTRNQSRLIKLMLQSWRRGQKHDNAQRLLKICRRHGRTILEVAGDSLTAMEIRCIAGSKYLGELRKIIASRSQKIPGWRQFVTVSLLKAERAPYLLNRIIEGNPHLVAEAFHVRPDLVRWKDVELVDPNDLVHAATHSKKFARKLDLRLTDRRRRSLLPVIRALYGNKPRSCAAYELAMLTELKLSRTFVSLALMLAHANQVPEGNTFNAFYKTYKLPKKSGGSRTITAPSTMLKAVQRGLLKKAIAPMDNSPSATGFRKGSSIVKNAQEHVNQKIVVNVDITAFFPNTRYSLIRQVAAQAVDGHLSPIAQWLLAEICSYQGALPTGAPTSPAVGNIVLKRADATIAKAAEHRRIKYTRYADDLTFSGEDGVVDILPLVVRTLGAWGYELDNKKTNIFRRGRRQIVTGLVVNEKPNMAKPLRRRLRSAVHRRLSGRQPSWHGKPMSDSELLGRIAFLAQTQPAEAKKLRDQLEAVQ
ncbi:MAG: RNA-directed DNA polymerase [Gammaproteobacteria bacterium]|nr:RNA-directed DNA polymerase [Gammaproteobacteria bacterium]